MVTSLDNNCIIPLVSIGISVYFVEPYIEKCLFSALNQIYMNLEILVVDDCYTDNSMTIVSALRNKHIGEFIRIYFLKKGVLQ